MSPDGLRLPTLSICAASGAGGDVDFPDGLAQRLPRKTVILGGVIVAQKQEGSRLWLHLKNRPLDKDYRPHRPTATTGPEAGLYWVLVPNASTLPPKWNQWARVTVVGRVIEPRDVPSSMGSPGEPAMTLLFMRGWTMGQAQQGTSWEESVDANYLLSVPEGLHGE